MNSTVGILVVTYAKDLPYLEYCLRSINKFASGFAEVVVLVPEQEKAMFEAHVPKAFIKTYKRTEDSRKWHLDAQLQKCKADLFCHSSYILHTDSDCIFTEPVTPEDYFVDGKPVMLIQSYKSLGNAVPWQACTSVALGHPAEYETMRRHPQVNPRGIYGELRLQLEMVHNKSAADYILSCKPDYPWFYSEHNAIGSFALMLSNWKSQYHWIDVEKQPYPHSKLAQFWSHSPPDQPQGLPSGGNATPLSEFKRLGLC